MGTENESKIKRFLGQHQQGTVTLAKWLDRIGISHDLQKKYRKSGWQRQLHLFEVPFYYIEYGIAQLGAIGLWMQFKKDREKALDNYINALSRGGTLTLPELYKTAGLEFNFAPEKIKELMEFVKDEMITLEGEVQK